MPAGELQETGEVMRLELAGLHLDRPLAPAALENAIDFERFLAPVRDGLTGVPGVCQAGVLDPGAEARWIGGNVGDALGGHHG